MSPKTKPKQVPCPGCGADTWDGLMCARCCRILREHLGELIPEGRAGLPWESERPGLLQLLDEQLARQGQTGTGVGGRGASAPLPYDGAARRALDAVRAALAFMVLHTGAGDGWPDDRGGELRQLTAMAVWLIERADRVRAHADAASMLDAVVRAVRYARHVVDQSAVSEYVGICDVCAGRMFRRAGSSRAVCTRCELVVDDARERREALLTDAKTGLATRDDILDAAPASYGVAIRDSTFSGWVNRGRLLPRGKGPGGRPLYRVSEVLDLARARARKKMP